MTLSRTGERTTPYFIPSGFELQMFTIGVGAVLDLLSTFGLAHWP